MKLLKLVEIQNFWLDEDSRVELPDDARIISVDGNLVWAEVVVERYNR